MTNTRAPLKAHVSLLGQCLGDTIELHHGTDFLKKIEDIRRLAKALRQGDQQDKHALVELLQSLKDAEFLPVCRAFSQFLNLANVAEQHHTTSLSSNHLEQQFETIITTLKQSKQDKETLYQTVLALDIELVLTAHPTEITRRTFIHKHTQLNACLERLTRNNLDPFQKQEVLDRIEQLISQAWHTSEIRNQRPTPVDEAKWGYSVIEQSLWQAVPQFMRRLDASLKQHFDLDLPHTFSPIRFASWMGGDRDGNPFVTAKVTEEVLLRGRLSALNLYEQEINTLASELSMSDCTPEFSEATHHHHEPYRVLLRDLRDDIQQSIRCLEQMLTQEICHETPAITDIEQIRTPLLQCYDSLIACNMKKIAHGQLRDILRRLACFGLQLTKLDVRQHSGHHTQALSELTLALGLGDYGHWDETQKQRFLCQELASQRPLIPLNWQPSAQTQEVLDTCTMIAKQPAGETLGLYVISMTSEASDILAARLLMKICGCQNPLPVAPLFETLDDLNRAPAVMRQLFELTPPQKRQWIMIGYSDSAKDAGIIAASWAQYCAMEALVTLAHEYSVSLTLFHGRGGSIGRGGGPAREAILSQPPGSLAGGLRVTEQGEMIRFKFGLEQVAQHSLALYTQAVLEANLAPPPVPEKAWRDLMDAMAQDSCQSYRDLVRDCPDFVDYFKMATPEQELAKLPLGSRPARRKASASITDLRAIPWIFAWSQTRLMLPAWLGTHAALTRAQQAQHTDTCAQMLTHWPFFKTRLDMLEMVFLKADAGIAAYYDQRLVPEALKPIGAKIHAELTASVQHLLALKPEGSLLDQQPWSRESIKLRNPYIDPLNVLQVELLRRARDVQDSDASTQINQALMVTIAGIAAGLRNTG